MHVHHGIGRYLGLVSMDLGEGETEFLLLEYLLEHAGMVMSRTQIMLGVWGYDFGADNGSLVVYIGYLRRKLGEPRLIDTVRGIGYVLR